MRRLVLLTILLLAPCASTVGFAQSAPARKATAAASEPQHPGGSARRVPTTPGAEERTQSKSKVVLQGTHDSHGLSFSRNVGQAAPGILWTSQGAMYRASFSRDAFVLQTAKAVGPAGGPSDKPVPAAAASTTLQSGLPGAVPRVEWSEQRIAFAGANPEAKVEALDELPGKVSLFAGRDPNRWTSGAATFARLRYKDVYPGIDVVFYGREGHLEYDFVVSPGADPGSIRMDVSGAEPPVVTANGSLQLGSFVHRPQLYQNLEDGKRIVEGRFVAVADHTVGFSFDHYDHSRTFILDPAISLVYSSYAGGLHNDQEFGIVTDAKGNSYIAGWSASQDFPVTGNALQPVRQNIGTYTYDAVILKFDPSGTLIYSTFLGGSANDQAGPIVVNPDGTVSVAGYTQSSDFPVTRGAYQTTYGGGLDGFLARLSADGSQLLYSTYLGGAGDEAVTSLLLNPDGSLWMSGVASAPGLTPSASAFQNAPKGVDNSFVAKVQFSQAGAMQMPYLTFIGGSQRGQTNGPGEGWPSSLAVDAAGNVYYAGTTQSSDFPVTANAYEQPFTLSHACLNSPNPNTTGVVTRFSPDLSQMLYSTYYGGKTEDQNGYPYCNQGITSIRLDGTGNIWLYGYTAESDLPLTGNALSSKLNTNGNAGGQDAFLGELSPDGTKLLYGTYFGGSQLDSASSMVFDASGNIWLSGISQSSDFPVTAGALQAQNSGGLNDFTISQLSPDGSKLLYSTYFGGTTDNGFYGAGLTLDAAGNVHLSGSTNSSNLPVTQNALQTAFASGDVNPDGADIFYSVLGSGSIGSVSPATGGNSGDLSITVTGSGFQIGATCRLTLGSVTLVSIASSVSPAGTGIACTFALNGASAGAYQVQVVNPNGGSTYTSTAPITLQSGGGPSLWANIVGRPKIRTGVPSVVTLNYGNSGNADSYLTQLQVNLPPGITATYDVGVAPSLISGRQIASSRATSSGSTIAVMVPHLAAGESHSFQLSITDPANNDAYSLSASVSLPWYSSLTQAMTDLTAQSKAFTPATACQPALATAPGVHNCLGLYLSQYRTGGATMAQTQTLAGTLLQQLQQSLIGTKPVVSTGTTPLPTSAYVNGTLVVDGLPSTDDTELVHDFGTSTQYLFPIDTGHCIVSAGNTSDALGGVLYKCTYSIPSPISGAQQFTGNSYSRLDLITNPGSLIPQFDTCWTKTFNVPGASFQLNVRAGSPCGISADDPDDDEDERDDIDPLPPVTLPGSTGGSIDPNAKVGNAGDGSARQYVNGTTPLPYAVYFENEAAASLPAATVVVTDQLDPIKVDLATLRFGTVTFGTNVIKPVQDTSSFDTTYSLNTSLSVRIQASLNPGNGLLRWTFQSIDPSTGLPPTDPTVGFLPPDADGVRGQGSVVFSVAPRSGLTTGTQILNAASVVFDTNAAINTPGWLNTLDVDAPVSKVLPLPATEPLTFPVSWSGTDSGSGIATYNVYVSDNGGAFILWQETVGATSASFTGVPGHTYAFLSAATDKAANSEAVRTAADTSTVVMASAGATTTTLSVSSATPALGTAVTFTALVASSAGAPSGTVTFLDGTAVLGTGTFTASSPATFSTSALAVGPHSITAAYGATSSFAGSTSAATMVTVQPAPAPDFTLSLSPASGSVTGGQVATTTLTLAPVNGFTQGISFSCAGLRAGATCTFQPSVITPGGATVQATLSIQTSATHGLLHPGSRPPSGKRSLPLLAGGLFCLLCVGRRRRSLISLSARRAQRLRYRVRRRHLRPDIQPDHLDHHSLGYRRVDDSHRDLYLDRQLSPSPSHGQPLLRADSR